MRPTAGAVNMIQMAAGIAQGENRSYLCREDIEVGSESGQLSPRPERRLPKPRSVLLMAWRLTTQHGHS